VNLSLQLLTFNTITYKTFKIAWQLLSDRVTKLRLFFSYAGRPTAASPATGSKMQHLRELKALLDDAMAV